MTKNKILYELKKLEKLEARNLQSPALEIIALYSRASIVAYHKNKKDCTAFIDILKEAYPKAPVLLHQKSDEVCLEIGRLPFLYMPTKEEEIFLKHLSVQSQLAIYTHSTLEGFGFFHIEKNL